MHCTWPRASFIRVHPSWNDENLALNGAREKKKKVETRRKLGKIILSRPRYARAKTRGGGMERRSSK